MSRARERREKRRQRQEMISKGRDSLRQIETPDNVKFSMPEIRLPGGRWLFVIPASLIVLIIVIAALGSVNPLEATAPPNAIWLDSSMMYTDLSDDEIRSLARTLQSNQIGVIYAYVSSLKGDNTWAGDESGRNRYNEVEASVRNFVVRMKQVYPGARIYGWIEVLANPADDYRLDDPAVHTAVADFAGRAIETLETDGVLLDVKPVVRDNDDYLTLLRVVRQQLGLDAFIAAAVPPDLSPRGTFLNLPEIIAPGTEWTDDFKQNVALLVDQVVVTAYNSYQTNPVDYIEWVRYQVETYSRVLNEISDSDFLVISIPDYADFPPAHDSSIESLAGALDGVLRGYNSLSEEQQALLQGVAIYSDTGLTDNDWAVYRDKWLNR